MSNMLRKLRREAGVWKRRERPKTWKHRETRHAPVPSFVLTPPPAGASETILGRLRAVFAPRSSSKGR
jgi:hypothetical protein